MADPVPMWSIPSWLAPLRTTARLLAVAVLGLVGLFLLAEELNPVTLTEVERLQMTALQAVACGLVIGLRFERLGGVLTVAAMVFFCTLEGLGTGRFPDGWIYAAIAMPGVLYLVCYWATFRVFQRIRRESLLPNTAAARHVLRAASPTT